VTDDWKPWVYYDGVLKNPGKYIKRHGKNLKPTTIGEGEGEIDESYRVADGKFFNSQELYAVAEDLMKRWRRDAKWSVRWSDFEELHMVRYGPGGRYDWHVDNELTPEEDRKITAIVALNDEYEGGGLDIMWPGTESHEHFDIAAGDAVVFPAMLPHRGVQVSSGERWILVIWATGKQWA
jgi:PKHD-type hydroxylase